MVLNHAVRGHRGECLRYELQHVGHHAELDLKTLQQGARLLRFEGQQLVDGNLPLFSRRPQLIGLGAGLLRGAKHPGHRIPPCKHGLQDRLAEILLSDDHYAHSSSPDGRGWLPITERKSSRLTCRLPSRAEREAWRAMCALAHRPGAREGRLLAHLKAAWNGQVASPDSDIQSLNLNR